MSPLSYETAKKLKDSGFPQKVHGKHILPTDEILDYRLSNTVYLPTLSELIDACGKDFEALVRREEDWAAYMIDEAYKGDCVSDCCGYSTGPTPEEAVANLWLALNIK